MAGIGVIILAAYVLSAADKVNKETPDVSNGANLLTNQTTSAPDLLGNKEVRDFSATHIFCYAVIVLGAIMTIIGFIGCCGAAMESQCLLGTVIQIKLLIYTNNYIILLF